MNIPEKSTLYASVNFLFLVWGPQQALRGNSAVHSMTVFSGKSFYCMEQQD